MAQHVLMSSFNCRELRDKKKRNELFLWLRNNYNCKKLTLVHQMRIFGKRNGETLFIFVMALQQVVAILVPHNFEILVTDVKHDSEGRYLLLDCTIEGNNFTLLNIYAPTKDKIDMQNVFLGYLHSVIDNYSDKNIILGGDFNVCLDPVIDKFGGRSEAKSEYCKNLENFIEEFTLVDI